MTEIVFLKMNLTF